MVHWCSYIILDAVIKVVIIAITADVCVEGGQVQDSSALLQADS